MATKRQPNFSSGEREELLNSVSKHLEIINSKDQKVEMQRRKKACWENIAEKVNAIGSNRRTGDECKKKWCDLKSEVKSKMAAQRQDKQATGGGPPTAPELSPHEQDAAAMMAIESFLGVSGGTDSMAAESPAESESLCFVLRDDVSPSFSAPNDSPPLKRGGSQASSPSGASNLQSVRVKPKMSKIDYGDMNNLYKCEEQRLQVEKERLEVERARLAVERERLAIEKARLEVEKKRA